MADKKKSPTPEERSSGASHSAVPHRQARKSAGVDSNITTHGVKTPLSLPAFASLKPLASRLIPLCRPNGTPGKCTAPSHKHDPTASGKVPLEKDWQVPNHKPHWPTEFNVGVRLGSHLCALDVDPRAGGDRTLKELEARFGKLPATPRVLTGGTGHHHYFSTTEDPASWRYNGVELKAIGSQVVAPGSLHVSGALYKWEVDPEQAPLAELPLWLRQRPSSAPTLALVPTPDPDPRSKWWIEDTLVYKDEEFSKPELIKRARLYVNAMPLSVSGHGGHDVGWRVANALVKGFALKSPDAMHLFAEWNGERAKPKWSKGELIHKLADAERSTHYPWGYLLRGERDKYEDVPEADSSDSTGSGEGEDPDDADLANNQKHDNRLVFVVSLSKFAFFPEGIEKTPESRDQGIQYIEKDAAIASLKKVGVSFDSASRIVRKKYCTIVEDVRRWPSNERIINQKSRSYLNPFWRLIPEPLKGPCPNIDALMLAIGGDEEGAKWLWNWAAYCIQDPNILPGVAVVAKSAAKGIGKSKLGEMLGACRGVCVTVNPTVFRSDFTSKWADARFVLAAEVMLADSRQEDNQKFLGYITDPEIEYHRKNQPAYDISNRIAWWLTSNLDNPVIVPKGDRRFTILDSVSPGEGVLVPLRAAWKRYESAWHEWDEIRCFKRKLLEYAVVESEARNPLLNQAHEDVEEASRSSPEAFADELRLQGWANVADATGLIGVTSTADRYELNEILVDPIFIYRVYQVWCVEHGQRAYSYNRFAHTHAMKSFPSTPQRSIKNHLYRLHRVPLNPKA